MKKLKVLMAIASVMLSLLVYTSIVFCFSAAIMVPGTIGDNPIWQNTVRGAEEAAEEGNFTELKILESGGDIASYEKNLITLAQMEKYDVILTSTDVMAKSVVKVSSMFPEQKLILMSGNIFLQVEEVPKNVFSTRFDEMQRGYLAGYFSGLVTKSTMPYANKELKVGVMFNDVIPCWVDEAKPGFEQGVKAVDPNIEVLYSIVGSWNDPTKGADVARAQYKQGVDIIWGPIGAIFYGVLNEAQNQKKYFMGALSNQIFESPDVIPACTVTKTGSAVKGALLSASRGEPIFGTSTFMGAKEGAVTFTFDDPEYLKGVPEEIRAKMLEVYDALAKGEIKLSTQPK